MVANIGKHAREISPYCHPAVRTMRFFSQSFLYDDSWSIVTLAFFLRYPNPYASHVLSCDVVSRDQTPSGSLLTTRLILKQGSLPRWFPKGIISRADYWVVEESEVDPHGKLVRCVTKNLDHVKVMQVEESVQFAQTMEGRALQHTQARIVSRFGWGLTKKIENHGLSRFKAHMQKSREGVSLILDILRQSRLRPMTMGVETCHQSPSVIDVDAGTLTSEGKKGVNAWTKFKSWFEFPNS